MAAPYISSDAQRRTSGRRQVKLENEAGGSGIGLSDDRHKHCAQSRRDQRCAEGLPCFGKDRDVEYRSSSTICDQRGLLLTCSVDMNTKERIMLSCRATADGYMQASDIVQISMTRVYLPRGTDDRHASL